MLATLNPQASIFISSAKIESRSRFSPQFLNHCDQLYHCIKKLHHFLKQLDCLNSKSLQLEQRFRLYTSLIEVPWNEMFKHLARFLLKQFKIAAIVFVLALSFKVLSSQISSSNFYYLKMFSISCLFIFPQVSTFE